MGRWRRFLTAAVLTAALATASVPAAPTAGAIVGGQDADPATSGFMARIDIVRTATSTYTCSGSLVAPRLVLTAAHCLFSRDVADWTVTFTGADPQTREVVALVPYSPTAGARDGGSTDDLAIVQLDRAVDRTPVGFDTDPGTLARLAAAAAPVIELGYGATTPGGTTSDGGRLRQAGQVVTGGVAGGAAATGVASILQAVPSGTGAVAAGSCANGDSGGPLVTPGARPVLLGVTSTAIAGAATCWSTRIDAGSPYRAWLDRLVVAPGSGTGETAPTAPTAPSTPTGSTGDVPVLPVPAPAPVGPPAVTPADLGPVADTPAGRLVTGGPAPGAAGSPVPIIVVFTR